MGLSRFTFKSGSPSAETDFENLQKVFARCVEDYYDPDQSLEISRYNDVVDQLSIVGASHGHAFSAIMTRKHATPDVIVFDFETPADNLFSYVPDRVQDYARRGNGNSVNVSYIPRPQA